MSWPGCRDPTRTNLYFRRHRRPDLPCHASDLAPVEPREQELAAVEWADCLGSTFEAEVEAAVRHVC